MRRGLLPAALRYAAILVTVLIFVFPLVWLFITSVKTRNQAFAMPPLFAFAPTADNYQRVLRGEFLHFLHNSAIIATASMAFSVFLGSLTAYGFSRYPLKGSEHILFWILSLRFLPVIAIAVPFYIVFQKLHMLDSYAGMILVYAIANIAFTVWLMKGFFDEVPRDIEEAATLEGQSPGRIFFGMVMPQVIPGLATTAIFCMIQTINEFLLALVLTNRAAMTMPVALAKFQVLGIDWGGITAAASLISLPVIVFTWIVRNQLVRGLSVGGMR